MKRRWLIPLLMLIPFATLASEEAPVGQHVAWTAVTGAHGYRVEFRREGVVVLVKETTDTEMDITLPPGVYTWTVAVINKFGKAGGVSAPQELVIEKILSPIVKRAVPDSVWSEVKTVEMVIELYQLHSRGDLYLVQGATRTQGEIQMRGEDRIWVRFDLEDFRPGSCDLELVNPAGVTGTVPGILIIREKPLPQFGSLSSEFLYAGFLHPDIVLTGTGFEEGMSVVFVSSSNEIRPVQIQVLSSTEARLWLDLRDVKKGRYALRLDNPSGLGSGGDQPVLEIDYTPEYYWKQRNFGSDILVTGMCYIVPEPDKDIPGFYPGLGIRMDIDFSDKVPVLRNWCFELRIEGIMDPAETSRKAFSVGGAAVFRTRRNAHWNYFLKGGLGGHWTVGENPVHGPLLFGSAGIDLNLFLHLIIQVEGNLYYLVYEGGGNMFFSVALSVGYRF